MRDMDVKRFIDAYHLLVSFSAAINNRPDMHGLPFDASKNALAIQMATDIKAILEEWGLSFSAETAGHVLNHMQRQSTLEELKRQIESMHGRINSELNRRKVKMIDPEYLQFYPSDVPLFGPKVRTKFHAAQDDIEEAGKCLAVDQSTACVFHLMRAMEVVVKALAKRLGMSVSPQTTWVQLSNSMRDKIRAMPENTEKKKRAKDAWYTAATALDNLGRGVRNTTMHPAQKYTRLQARDVFESTRAFMQRLSEL